MAEYRRAEVISGAFVVASAAAFALFAFKIGGLTLPGFGETGVRCFAYFDEISSLDKQQKVSVGGVKVGTVTDISWVARETTAKEVADEKSRIGSVKEGWEAGRVRTRIRVDFLIFDGSLRVGDNAVVALGQDGFLSPVYLKLDLGTWPADRPPRTLAEAGPPPNGFASRAGGSLMDDAITLLRPTLRELEGILTKVNRDLLSDAAKNDLQSLIPNLSRDLARGGDLIKNLTDLTDAKNPDSIQKVVLSPAGDLLNEARADLIDLKRKIDASWPEVQKLLDRANGALKTGNDVLAKLDAAAAEGAPKLQGILDNLREGTKDLKGRLDAVQSVIADARRVLSNLDATMGDVRPDLREMMRTFRNVAWQLELAVRKVRANPAVVLFGDNEQDFGAEPRDESGLRKSGRAKPYEQRDETKKAEK